MRLGDDVRRGGTDRAASCGLRLGANVAGDSGGGLSTDWGGGIRSATLRRLSRALRTMQHAVQY